MALSNKNILTFLLISSLIVGCSGIERQTEKAMKAAEVAFRDDEKQPNQEAGLIQVYLPKDYKVVEEHDNNLILQKGDKIYILFVNPNERRQLRAIFGDKGTR